MICGYRGLNRNGVYITERDGMAVVKLDSGYNIGVPPGSLPFYFPCRTGHRQNSRRFSRTRASRILAIVSTGGTIASRIDYRTGSVTSQFNANDILTAIPELKEIANYRTVPACHHPLGEHDTGHLAGACPGSI